MRGVLEQRSNSQNVKRALADVVAEQVRVLDAQQPRLVRVTPPEYMRVLGKVRAAVAYRDARVEVVELLAVKEQHAQQQAAEVRLLEPPLPRRMQL